MEIPRNQTATAQPDTYSFESIPCDNSEKRLNALVAINAEIEREKGLFLTNQEKMEAAMMKNPLSVKKAFAYFGLMLGTFPPAAIFFKVASRGSDEFGLFFLLLLVNIVCALVGFFSGKLIGKMVLEMEKRSWNLMMLTLPFIGIIWGIITGGAGGIFIFVIGAFFGAFIASMVGAVAVPAFTIFHRLLKKGEMIERNQFLPLAFGITFIISAFILGL